MMMFIVSSIGFIIVSSLVVVFVYLVCISAIFLFILLFFAVALRLFFLIVLVFAFSFSHQKGDKTWTAAPNIVSYLVFTVYLLCGVQ